MAARLSDAEWVALLRQELSRLVARHDAIRPGKVKAAGLCLADQDLGSAVVLAPAHSPDQPVLLELAAAVVNAAADLEPPGISRELAKEAERLLRVAAATRYNPPGSLHDS